QGTYGFWAPDGYIAVTDLEVYQIDDTTGFSTTDAVNWQDIPNFEISITLDQTAIVLVLMRISAHVLVEPGNSAKGFYRLVYNGSPVRGQAILGGQWGSGTNFIWAPAVVMDARELGPGTHVFKAQIKADTDFP